MENDGVHDFRIVQKNGSAFTHSHGEARKHHAFAAVQEGIADVIGRQFADDTGEKTHDDEHGRNFIHVEIKFQNADDDAHKVQPQEAEGNPLTGGEMRRFIQSDGADFCLVDFIDRAALRILFHLVGMVHDEGDIDGNQNHKECHAVWQSGENRNAGNTLRYAYGEWLRHPGAIAGSDGAEKDAQRRQRVEAQRQRCAHHQWREGQIFFVAACQGGEGSQCDHEDRNHQDAMAFHFLDQCGKPCHDGAGLCQDAQRTAYHEEEGDDADAAFETFIDSGKEIQESCGILCYIVEGRRIDDHFTGIHIFYTFIYAGRNHIAGDGTQHNDAHQNQNRTWRFKCFYIFFHE